MDRYIGTKVIEARPMNLGEYNKFRGWSMPSDEDPARPGYQVTYEDGYLSWSPSTAFESAYQQTNYINFGLALEALRMGYTLRRQNWGKGKYLYLVPGSTFEVNRAPLSDLLPPGTVVPYRSHIDLRSEDETCVPWTPTQVDLLALDWGINF